MTYGRVPGHESGHGADGAVAAWLFDPGQPTPSAPPGLNEPSSRVFRTMLGLLRHAGVRVEGRFARVEGRRVHWLVAGAGPPVVLLHGGSGGGANWYRLLKPLAERHTVLAPDLPGFGLSESVDPEPPLGVQVARLIGAWLRAAGIERAAVMGTSLGGLAALYLAAAEPRTVSRLVLLDTVGGDASLSWLVRLAALRPLAFLTRRETRPALEWTFRRLMVADPAAIPEAERAALLDYLWASSRAGAATTVARSLRHFGGLRGQREVPDAGVVGGVAAPTLVVWGGRDRFVPVSGGRALARGLPDARLHVIAHAGHSPNWEAPGALLEVVRPFLEASPEEPGRA